jgi:enolase
MTTTCITSVHGREVLDSRGHPTVEVEISCGTAFGAARGRAIVPAGASTGQHEARELRDADPTRYHGRGVLQAVEHVNSIIGPALLGRDAADQAALDRRLIELDGTPGKSHLGANAVLGASLAAAHAVAAARQIPLYEHVADLFQTPQPTLPLPMVNMLSGGLHAGGNLDFQDFLIMPIAATTYRDALRWIVAVYRSLGTVLADRGFEAVLVGDEGGYGPRLDDNEQAIQLVVQAIAAAGFEPGRDIAIAIDVASSHFFRDARYVLRQPGPTPSGTPVQALDSATMVDLLCRYSERYPIVSLEDGCAEDDWTGWRLLSGRLRDRLQLVGDDLFVTNAARLRHGVDAGVANAVLVKPNQIGTLSETLDVIRLAHEAGYRAVISARSGETEDVTLAHVAVGTAAGQIKIGSVARSERLAKYNELLRIEERLGKSARFAGPP